MEESRPKKKAIIIVEDNLELAELIQQALNDEPDFEAVAVHEGASAIELISSVKASLILMDIMLPGLSGLEIYDKLQQDPNTKQIPVLFCTAAPGSVELRQRDIPKNQVIHKPFDIDDLVNRVAEVCRAADN